MGECMYYLKARFPKGLLSKEKSKKIIKFFKMNQEDWAYDTNGEELIDRLHFHNDDTTYDDLSYMASVSHMSDWRHLQESLIKFGATKVIWGDEESGICSLDGLQFEDNEQIVKDILKRKILLPSLIGINDELDALIADKLAE